MVGAEAEGAGARAGFDLQRRGDIGPIEIMLSALEGAQDFAVEQMLIAASWALAGHVREKKKGASQWPAP